MEKILVPFFKFHQTIKHISGSDWNSNIDQIALTLIQNTMLQKLSKCEVRAWLYWNVIILQPFRFYMKWNFGKYVPKMTFLAILETLNFEFLVNLGFESCSTLLKSHFTTSKIAQNDIFGPFPFTKMWFHVKFEWR